MRRSCNDASVESVKASWEHVKSRWGGNLLLIKGGGGATNWTKPAFSAQRYASKVSPFPWVFGMSGNVLLKLLDANFYHGDAPYGGISRSKGNRISGCVPARQGNPSRLQFWSGWTSVSPRGPAQPDSSLSPMPTPITREKSGIRCISYRSRGMSQTRL